MTKSTTQEYFLISNLIKTYGSNGFIHHLKAQTNTYDENGDEIALTDTKYEKTTVIYSSRRVRTLERSPLSKKDDMYRFSIILEEDTKIFKSDKFEDINGILYPIEQIDYIGDRAGEILYQLYCQLD